MRTVPLVASLKKRRPSDAKLSATGIVTPPTYVCERGSTASPASTTRGSGVGIGRSFGRTVGVGAAVRYGILDWAPQAPAEARGSNNAPATPTTSSTTVRTTKGT